MPPRGNKGRVSVSSLSSSSAVAESKTDREGDESKTEGSHVTELIPRASGLFSSSSVIRSWEKLLRRLIGLFQDAKAATLDEVPRVAVTTDLDVAGSTNADAIDAEHKSTDRGNIAALFIDTSCPIELIMLSCRDCKLWGTIGVEDVFQRFISDYVSR